MPQPYAVPAGLSQQTRRSETFSISKLFFVALCGGTIALTALSVKNAKMLKMSQLVITFMITAAIIAIGLKVGFYYAYFQEWVELEQREFRYAARILEISLFVIFYFILRKSYQNHMQLVGGERPILKPAILWCSISIVIELALAMFMSTLG